MRAVSVDIFHIICYNNNIKFIGGSYEQHLD